MKQINYLLISVILFVFILPLNALAVTALLPHVTSNPAENISVPLTVDDLTDLYAIDLTVTFAEPVIDATGAVLTGGVLEEDYAIQYNTNIDGEIRVTIYCTGNLYSGSGVVSYLEFDVVGSAGDYTDLHFTQFDINEINFLANTTDGSVTVEGSPGWSVNPAAYEYNGNITSGVFEDGIIQLGEVEDSVAAFCGDECRGVIGGFLYPPVDEVVFMLTVYSNETSGDILNFKYYDASENIIYTIDDISNVVFIPDMVLGSLDPYAPYVLSINTAVDGPDSQQDIELKQNYPNPFEIQTNIQFELKKPNFVKLIIYNPQGKKLKTVVNEYRNAGVYIENWYGKDKIGNKLNNGVYYYCLKIGEFKKFKKLLLMK